MVQADLKLSILLLGLHCAWLMRAIFKADLLSINP